MDIDGDGIVDILSGSYSRMEQDMAGLFQVLYGKKGGTFRKAEPLKGGDAKVLLLPGNREKNLTDRICTRPFAVDWDGDGKLDLVVGTFTGTFFWFKGEGKGKFSAKAQPILVDGKPLKVPGSHSDPFVIDINGDGTLDLMSGSTDGGVYWAENVAGKGKPPQLKPFSPLVKPGRTIEYGKMLRETDLKRPTYASRVWVADVNGDGKLDLIVGDSVTLIEPAKGLTEAEMKKKQSEWQGELQAAQAALSKTEREKEIDAKTKAKARAEYQKIYNKRSEFMKQEMTGFVWVYLQK